MMRVIIAAGASGGHIFPAIAVADQLKRDLGAEVLFVGVGKEIERKLVTGAGYRLEAIPFPPFSGSGVKGLLRAAFFFAPAVHRARVLFSRERPQIIVGFGGYPAFIPVVTAWIQRIPRIVHEQNTQVGVANKFLSLLANKVFAVTGAVGFPSSVAPGVVHLPNPLREVFYGVADWRAPAPGEPFRILVLGGSQGAVKLNAAVMAIAPLLMRKNVALVHQTGEQDYENVSQTYQRLGYADASAVRFVDDVAREYAKAHLIISRAGAMSAAEIAACGRPAIFVPLVIARSHQKQNILPLLDAGAARMLEQDESLAERLGAEVDRFLGDPQLLGEMAGKARAVSMSGGQTAAQRIVDAVRELTRSETGS